ncbi:MAG: hypothetical protein F9K40_17310, partial [Kofleriaceae bacterium]
MWFRIVSLLCLIALVAGCPKKRHTLVPSVPTNGDVQARERFLEARARFLRDGNQADEFRAIATEYAGDPIEPFALLFAGVASQQAGDPTAAVASLEKLLALQRKRDATIERADACVQLAQLVTDAGERKALLVEAA